MVVLRLKSEGKQSHDFNINYQGRIDLRDGNYEVGLTGGTIEFSWDNICPKYNNNILKYFNGKDWISFVIPSGYYDSNELTQLMHSHFESISDEECPIIFDVNNTTRRYIIALEEGYKIDFTEGKLSELLGFESKIIEDKVNIGKYDADINRGITQYLIHCSIVEGSYLNTIDTDVIYSFYPENALPGDMLNLVRTTKSTFLPINKRMIHELRMYITDQLGRPVYLNDRPVFYELTIRKNLYI